MTIAEALAAPTLAKRILLCRQIRGFTQRRLAERTGVAWSQVSFWEQRNRRPGVDNFFALADALGVDPLSLYYGAPP